MRWLEDILNLQSDWDFGWGPLIGLRPTKNTRMGLRVLIMYYLPALVFCWLLIIAVFSLLWMLNPSRIFSSPQYDPNIKIFGMIFQWMLVNPTVETLALTACA